MNTVEKLERLGEIKKATEKLKADETAEIQTIPTPEIRAEIEKISLKSFRKLRSTISAAIGQRLKFLSTGNTNAGIRRKRVRSRKKARK